MAFFRGILVQEQIEEADLYGSRLILFDEAAFYMHLFRSTKE